MCLGLHEEALPLLQAALDVLESQVTRDAAALGSVLNSLSACLITTGHTEEAARLCNRALTLRHQEFGMIHRDTLASLHNCALCYEAAGQAAEAPNAEGGQGFEQAIDNY